MVNGLGVVGWGVGGIEAEAAMLGQPISMLIPQVLGFRLTGVLPRGATATDLVLTITEVLRKHGVVGKFVEFFGEGLRHLTIADRATLGNMCPEYGATVAIFPIDDMTLDYLRLTGRDDSRVKLVEDYAKAQGLFRTDGSPEAIYTETIELDLSTVEPSLAGPEAPAGSRVAHPREGRVPDGAADDAAARKAGKGRRRGRRAPGRGGEHRRRRAVGRGAWPTRPSRSSITARSSSRRLRAAPTPRIPSVMIGAGLLAKKAVEKGLTRKPWVKSSLAPGSKVVTEYLDAAGLTRISTSSGSTWWATAARPASATAARCPDEVSAVIREKNLVVCSVLSGNRNFEGRIQQDVRANYLASPPLVVAYALAGWMTKDLTTEPLGEDRAGRPVYLKDIWPTEQELQETMLRAVTAEHVQAELCRTSSPATSAGRDWRSPRAAASSGIPSRPTSASRRSSKA